MALTQTRPYEEELYVQLDPGEDGYIAPEEIQVLVDHESWTRPKRLPLTMLGIGASHVEKDTLTGLTSRTVTVTFDVPFTDTPVGQEPQVYRMTEVAPNKFRKDKVLWGFTNVNQPTLTGFSIEIDSSESLTGVVVQYLYQ